MAVARPIRWEAEDSEFGKTPKTSRQERGQARSSARKRFPNPMGCTNNRYSLEELALQGLPPWAVTRSCSTLVDGEDSAKHGV